MRHCLYFIPRITARKAPRLWGPQIFLARNASQINLPGYSLSKFSKGQRDRSNGESAFAPSAKEIGGEKRLDGRVGIIPLLDLIGEQSFVNNGKGGTKSTKPLKVSTCLTLRRAMDDADTDFILE